MNQRMPHAPIVAVALLVVSALAGCASSSYSAYSEPYVVFESEHRMAMQNVMPATVVSIDGREVAGRKDPVKPGTHTIQASISGLPPGNLKTVTVDAQPCTRYYLGARRPPQGAADWVVSVTASEPIGECKGK